MTPGDDDPITWDEVDSPSEAALDVAESLGGRVVRLTRWNGVAGEGEGVVVTLNWWDGVAVRKLTFDA